MVGSSSPKRTLGSSILPHPANICYNVPVKTCNRCKVSKVKSSFNIKKRGDGLQPFCRKCDNSYSKDWYRRNSQKRITQVRDRVRDLRKKIAAYKRELCCSKCGYSGKDHPETLDFDHNGDKEIGVSLMPTRGYSWGHILQEILKCDILCANCHRIKTFDERRTVNVV